MPLKLQRAFESQDQPFDEKNELRFDISYNGHVLKSNTKGYLEEMVRGPLLLN
jgi:hypothetical protein